jgi:hypothetical protein
MAAHKGPANLRPRCTRSGSCVAAIPLYQSTTRSISISGNSEGSKKLPDDGRLLPKHVGGSIWNKGVVQIGA